MLNKEEYIQKWSDRLSIPIEVINKDYNDILQEEQKLHPTGVLEDLQTRALQRLALTFKKQLRSPAVSFEGIIIGVGDVVDTVMKKRKEAIDFFNTNPQKSIEMGITDINGNPLDVRKEWSDGKPNNNFGKPLPENSYLRNIFGIAMKSTLKDAKPKFFSMTISGEVAKNDNINMFKPVRFRAIDKTPQEVQDKFILNSSTFSKFDIDETIKLPSTKELINTYCSNLIVKMSNLQEYHNRVKEDFNRIVIVEGDVSTLVMEPSSAGSRRLIIEDSDNIDLESKGLTCWIPLRIPIDFAEQSKVLIVGRTGQGTKKDEAGNKTEELGDININTFGVYAIPEYKILPLQESITEETPSKEDW